MENNKQSLNIKLGVIIFWIAMWQIAAMIIGIEVFLPTPISVLKVFGELFFVNEFWLSIIVTLLRVLIGFLIGLVLGVIMAVLTCKIKIMDILFSLPLSMIKATPVASFIILLRLWLESSSIPIFIGLLMVMPIVWGNISTGIKATDKKMLEVGKVFKFNIYKKVKYIYIPQCRTYFYSSCVMGIGFCWKSAVAAEVLATPKNGIGTNLYASKLYLETAELFAWTIVVIILSVLVELVFVKLIKKLIFKDEGI